MTCVQGQKVVGEHQYLKVEDEICSLTLLFLGPYTAIPGLIKKLFVVNTIKVQKCHWETVLSVKVNSLEIPGKKACTTIKV